MSVLQFAVHFSIGYPAASSSFRRLCSKSNYYHYRYYIIIVIIINIIIIIIIISTIIVVVVVHLFINFFRAGVGGITCSKIEVVQLFRGIRCSK